MGEPALKQPDAPLEVTVTELGLAAFYMMNDIEMVSCKWRSNHYEVVFRNPNPDNPEAGMTVFKNLRNRFDNSPFSIFDLKLKTLRRTARQR